jgi:phosphoglycerol transferase MdoB-like AlkP superfamily enzyme
MENFSNYIEALKIIVTVSILFVWIVRYDNIKREFMDYKFPSWFRDFIGILKISFSLMLHSNYSQVVLIGSFGILTLMIGAVFTHIKNRSIFRKYIASVAMFIICSLIFYFTLG